jgi:hypothetical protein
MHLSYSYEWTGYAEISAPAVPTPLETWWLGPNFTIRPVSGKFTEKSANFRLKIRTGSECWKTAWWLAT